MSKVLELQCASVPSQHHLLQHMGPPVTMTGGAPTSAFKFHCHDHHHHNHHHSNQHLYCQHRYRLVRKMIFLHRTLRHRQKLKLFQRGRKCFWRVLVFVTRGLCLSDMHSHFNRNVISSFCGSSNPSGVHYITSGMADNHLKES